MWLYQCVLLQEFRLVSDDLKGGLCSTFHPYHFNFENQSMHRIYPIRDRLKHRKATL